jgi:hypothetical protein
MKSDSALPLFLAFSNETAAPKDLRLQAGPLLTLLIICKKGEPPPLYTLGFLCVYIGFSLLHGC